MSDRGIIDIESAKAAAAADKAMVRVIAEEAGRQAGPLPRWRRLGGGVSVKSDLPIPERICRKPWTERANDNAPQC